MKKISIALLSVLLVAAMPLLAQESKDTPPSGGSVAPLFGGVIGPDAFGYTAIDSASGNCPFQFVDISTTGTLVVSGDDVSSGPLALQGPFNFYGTDVASLNMASNGYITTDDADTGPDLSNDCPLPAVPSTPAATMGLRMYPLHDDLVTNTGFFQYFADCPRPTNVGFGSVGCHVFHYDEATHFGGAEVFDVQVIIYDDTFEIVFQHDDRNPELGSGSTTGIQNGDSTIGLTYACDSAASIPANSAQCFLHPFPNVLEPPAVPAMNTWGVIALALLLMVVGSLLIRRVEN